jgi:hypothetical protein
MEEDKKFIAILNQDNLVINVNVFEQYSVNPETNEIITNNLEDLLNSFPDGYELQQYSTDDTTITNNPASIGYTYDSQLNAFIPPCPDETYILNAEDFNWYPDPELEYDLNGDGVLSKWIPEIGGWRIVEETPEE